MVNISQFEHIANAWSELLNFPITPLQVVLMLLELKVIHIKDKPEYFINFINLMEDKRYVSALEEVFFGDKQ